MIVRSEFKPAWWLPGGHLQTLWAKLFRPDIKLNLTRERIELSDGDFIDLDWLGKASNGPLVMVLHGLEGSIESGYAKGLLSALEAQGLRAVFMHFRGCSGEANRQLKSYHSGQTHDLDELVRLLKQREPNTALSAVGFSLGGNVLLKWLGETQQSTQIERAVAVCVPMLLDKVADHIGKGFSRLYETHLVKRMQEKMIHKCEHNECSLTVPEIKELNSFWDFDDKVTAPLNGFKNATHYYQQCSSRQYLKHIQVPTLIIQAENDPFMSPEVLPSVSELSLQVVLELSQSGGHVGFVAGAMPGFPEYWLDQRIATYLKEGLGDS